MSETQTNFLTFKSRPIVRMGGIIYYGDPGEKYVIMLQVLSSEDFKGIKLSGRVSIQLQLTDPDVKATERIVKRTEKDGLYNAMDIGDIWLERALKDDGSL